MKKHASTTVRNLRAAHAPAPITAEEFDALHDSGEDISAYMDESRAVRPGRVVQRVNVDFPLDLLRDIDQEARRLGVTRQAFIKVRLADALGKAPTTR